MLQIIAWTQKITVNIYSAAVGGTPTAYQMTEGDYGVWSVTVKENLKGKFYAFNVFGEYPEFQGKKDVVDPYAKCVIGKTGRAMVINEKSYGNSYDYPCSAESECLQCRRKQSRNNSRSGRNDALRQGDKGQRQQSFA